jgi:hypothetical protein
LYGSADEFHLQHNAIYCGAWQYDDDFGDGSYWCLVDGAIFAAADESTKNGLACCTIAVESCRLGSNPNPTIVADEFDSAGLSCCYDRVWRRACNSFGGWFESRPA